MQLPTWATASIAAVAVLSISSSPSLVAATRVQDKQTMPAKDTMTDEAEKISKSIEVLNDLTAAPDKGIPQNLLDSAEAIVVIPSLVKGGFVVGAKHGKGVVSVRDRATNTWSAPAFVKLTGGSIGWQIGLEQVDLVMLVMNRKGVDDLLSDKFTIGGSASLTAGPVGRNADAGTDAKMSSQILAYSRAKGLFAGASLEGAALHGDDDDNKDFYGQKRSVREIVIGNAPASQPPMAKTWQSTIARITHSK